MRAKAAPPNPDPPGTPMSPFVCVLYRHWLTYYCNLRLDKIIKSVNKIERIMVAYKIFYVGCSRAKRNLTVILDKEKIEGFEDKLKQKLELVGFKVVDASKSQIT